MYALKIRSSSSTCKISRTVFSQSCKWALTSSTFPISIRPGRTGLGYFFPFHDVHPLVRENYIDSRGIITKSLSPSVIFRFSFSLSNRTEHLDVVKVNELFYCAKHFAVCYPPGGEGKKKHGIGKT